jgi:hypothetical protein
MGEEIVLPLSWPRRHFQDANLSESRLGTRARNIRYVQREEVLDVIALSAPEQR